MKKNTLKGTLFLAASALALTSVVSCSDYTEFTEGEIKQDLYNQKYDEAFVKQFGQPDPNHDWGMDEHVGVIGAFSSLSTRAGEIVINRNQWTEFDSKTTETFPTYNGSSPSVQVPVFKESALGHDIKIPGFPHLNGLYYTANGNVSAETLTGDNVTSGMIPAGDVTPYEIQYVSNWFRTHKNPVSNVDLHLSDFFIQNVSWDNDQVDYNTTGITPYKRGWEKTGNNGKNIETAAEAKAHTAWNGGEYVKENILNEPVSYFLDQLGFQDIEGEWTHVNNFNSGNSNFDPENRASNPNRMIMYVKSSGTENFRCKPSWCTDTPWIDEWVLVHLTWYETVKDGNSPYPVGTVIPREGYYLGFDFYGTKSGQTIYRDGYYSNWIVKITPGYFAPTSKSKRIFCEDLGGSFDFDFNDAVVDVAFEQKGTNDYEPIISVQAAGGTMPIYIQKNNSKYELHRLLGKKDTDPTYKPINVGSSGGSHAVAIYRGAHVAEDKAGKINIYVNNTKNNTDYKISGGTEDANGNTTSVDPTKNPAESTLDGSTVTNKTKAPSAFSAPTTVAWMQELQNITKAYTKFPTWVADHTQEIAWYNTVEPGAPLFDASEIQHGTGIYEPPTQAGETSYDEAIKWEELVPDNTGTAPSTAASVYADSYMKINDYGGELPPIVNNLNFMGNEGRVTFVVILSADANDYNLAVKTGSGQTEKYEIPENKKLQGIMTPADIIHAPQITYKGTEFATSVFARFKDAVYVPGKDGEFGQGRYTYTLEFSFKESDIERLTEGYHDYILFYLKGAGAVIGNGNATGVNGNVKVEKWYVHY